MESATIDSIMLRSRLALVELMVVKLDVLARRELLRCTTSEALRETLAAYEEAAQALEKMVYQRPELQRLNDAERAHLADEFREMIDQMKERASGTFGSLK